MKLSKKITLLNVFIFLAIVAIIVSFLWFDVYELDDYFQSFFYSKSIRQLLYHADHAKFLSVILMKSVCHGTSVLMKINPNDNVIPRIVIGMDFAILSYLYAKLVAISGKQRLLKPSIYLSFFIGVIGLTLVHSDYLVRWNQHFEYIFVFIIFLLFFNRVAYYFFNNKLPQARDSLKDSMIFLAFGVSSYVNLFVGALVLLGIFLYYKQKYTLNYKELLVSEKYSYVRIPLLLLITASFAIFMNPCLHIITEARLGGKFNLLEFLYYWSKSMFLNPTAIILNLLYVTLLIVVLKKYNKNTRQVWLSTSLIIASMLFQFFLGGLGKTCKFGDYWVSFERVYLMHYYFVLMGIAILVGPIKKQATKVLLTISFLVAIYTLPKFVDMYKYSKHLRREMYMIVKAENFYINKKAEFAPVPLQYINWGVYTGFSKDDTNWCMLDFYLNFKRVYKKKALKFKFYETDEFLEKAKKDGLIFTQQELANPKFTNLMN